MGCTVPTPRGKEPRIAQSVRPPAINTSALPADYVAGLAGATPSSKPGAAEGSAGAAGPPPSSGDQRAGSILSAPQAGVTPPQGVDPRAFNEVISQLESIGAIDPAKQARLLEDLKQTDPSLWPLMLQAFRASLAYHEQLAAKGGDAGGAKSAAARGERDASATARARISAGEGNAPHLALPTEVAGSKTAPRNEDAGSTASEPGRFAIADSERAPRALHDAPINEQRTSGTQSAERNDQLARASSKDEDASPPVAPSHTSNNAKAPKQSPASVVQQASYQQKLPDDDFEGHLTAAIRALEAKTQKSPEGPDDVAAHAYLRILYLAAGRRDEALRPIAGVTPAEQDFWTKQLWSLATYLDSERSSDAPRRAAEAAQQLGEAASKLGEMATLVVRNLAFCTDIRSYGVFTRFKDYEFTAGQRLLLYAEIENFKSVHTRKGYHTALKCSYQILDAQGRRVAGDESSAMEEYCQNPRRDYFLSYEHLSLPTPMYDGRYTLQLTIEDTLAQKVGQSSIEFTVKAK